MARQVQDTATRRTTLALLLQGILTFSTSSLASFCSNIVSSRNLSSPSSPIPQTSTSSSSHPATTPVTASSTASGSFPASQTPTTDCPSSNTTTYQSTFLSGSSGAVPSGAQAGMKFQKCKRAHNLSILYICYLPF